MILVVDRNNTTKAYIQGRMNTYKTGTDSDLKEKGWKGDRLK